MSASKAGPDAARSRTDGGNALAGLTSAWAELVSQLALGPEPEVRECPSCHAIGIREATTCGFCWAKLVPPAREVVTKS